MKLGFSAGVSFLINTNPCPVLLQNSLIRVFSEKKKIANHHSLFVVHYSVSFTVLLVKQKRSKLNKARRVLIFAEKKSLLS